MANLTTSLENSQGVIFYEKSPASSSDFNEFQSVFNNKFQAVNDEIMIEYQSTGSAILITAVNIKNKVVSKIEGVSITLPKLVNKIHIFTRSVLVTSPTDTIYKYGLRSNSQTTITGADTTTPNNIVSAVVGRQVSNRNLIEWTLVISDNTPSLSGWIYEGFVTVGKSQYTGKSKIKNISNNQYSVDYILTGSASLSQIDANARSISWSGRNLVLDLTISVGNYCIYKWDGTKWVIIQSVSQPDTIIYGADIISDARVPSTDTRVPGEVIIIYLSNESIAYKVFEFSAGGGSEGIPETGGTFTGPISMSGNKITNLGNPSAPGDAVNYSTLQSAVSGIPSYTLPTASASTLGGVKVGSGLSIDNNGVLSSSGGGSSDIPIASKTTLGGVKLPDNNSEVTVDSSTGIIRVNHINNSVDLSDHSWGLISPSSTDFTIGDAPYYQLQVNPKAYLDIRSVTGASTTLDRRILYVSKNGGVGTSPIGMYSSIDIGYYLSLYINDSNGANINLINKAAGSSDSSNYEIGFYGVNIGHQFNFDNRDSSETTNSGSINIGNNITISGSSRSTVLLGNSITTGSSGVLTDSVGLGSQIDFNGVNVSKTVLIGNSSYISSTSSVSNSIGLNGSISASNQITLGNSSVTQLRCQVQTISTLSDPRVKEEIELADTVECLESVLNLPVSRYKYKDFTGTHLDTHVTGWLSTDYKKVFPKGVQITDEVYPELDELGNQMYEEIEVQVPIDIDDESKGYKTELKSLPKKFTIKDVESITPTEALPTLWGAVQAIVKIMKANGLKLDVEEE